MLLKFKHTCGYKLNSIWGYRQGTGYQDTEPSNMQDGRQWVLSMLSRGDEKEGKEIMMTSNCGYNLLFRKGWALC